MLCQDPDHLPTVEGLQQNRGAGSLQATEAGSNITARGHAGICFPALCTCITYIADKASQSLSRCKSAFLHPGARRFPNDIHSL